MARTTFEEIAAKPEHVAREAAKRPVRTDRSDGPPMVLVSADAFEALQRQTVKELQASELVDGETSDG